MVYVKYSHRIVCDRYFIEWLKKQPSRKKILSRLMYIKSSSETWKKTHNIILKNEFEIAKTYLTDKFLRASFKVEVEPDFLSSYDDNISKTLVYAIYLTDESPYRCHIFTSPDRVKDYHNNVHYRGITSTTIVSGDEAESIINSFFGAFCNVKDSFR